MQEHLALLDKATQAELRELISLQAVAVVVQELMDLHQL
jgi:hypothetical protein